jgi:hypothetical protein
MQAVNSIPIGSYTASCELHTTRNNPKNNSVTLLNELCSPILTPHLSFSENSSSVRQQILCSIIAQLSIKHDAKLKFYYSRHYVNRTGRGLTCD